MFLFPMRKTSFLLRPFSTNKSGKRARRPACVELPELSERGREDVVTLPALVDAATADRRQITISGRKKTSVFGSAPAVVKRRKEERRKEGGSSLVWMFCPGHELQVDDGTVRSSFSIS